jgi:cytoskeletal protein RodZ
MDDKDSLYFSFDDQEEPAADQADVTQEEGSNRGFLIGAGVLAALFLIGICVIVLYLFVLRPQQTAQNQGPSPNELTNNANMTLFAATQTADFQTQSAATEPPSPTSAAQTTATPTSGLVAVTPKTPVSAVGGGTPGTPGTSGLGGAQSTTTGTPGTAAPSSGSPTASIIEVTVLGGTPGSGSALGGGSGATQGTAKPTSSIIEVTASGGSGGGSQPTGVGGPIGPTVQSTLPSTGFTGGAGFAGVGLLAVVLVAVVVIVRRIRLNS